MDAFKRIELSESLSNFSNNVKLVCFCNVFKYFINFSELLLFSVVLIIDFKACSFCSSVYLSNTLSYLDLTGEGVLDFLGEGVLDLVLGLTGEGDLVLGLTGEGVLDLGFFSPNFFLNSSASWATFSEVGLS